MTAHPSANPGTVADLHALTWKIPTPRGLWYRAFVVVPAGVYVTAEVEVLVMKQITKAAEVGVAEVIAAITDHGRAKQADFHPVAELRGIKHHMPAGTMRLVSESLTSKVRVPDRARLEELVGELNVAISQIRRI